MKKLIVSILSLSVIALAGCGSTVTEPTQTVPDYNTVTAAITEYEDAYREFVNGGEGEVQFVTGTSETPLGAPCDIRYSRTTDGRFESCSLTVTRDREEHDEYMNVSPDLMLFVRTFVDDEAELIQIDKYICTGGAVYHINPETQTLEPVEDVTALDCFITFSQVRTAYGPSDSADPAAGLSETQVAA